jgi:hypothetical protein
MDWDLDAFLQVTLPLAAFGAWFIKRLDKKFDKIDARFDKVDERFDKIDESLKEHGERLAFLEAAGIYTMPMEPSQPNPRSVAAREMWKRRRTKKVEQKKSH